MSRQSRPLLLTVFAIAIATEVRADFTPTWDNPPDSMKAGSDIPVDVDLQWTDSDTDPNKAKIQLLDSSNKVLQTVDASQSFFDSTKNTGNVQGSLGAQYPGTYTVKVILYDGTNNVGSVEKTVELTSP